MSVLFIRKPSETPNIQNIDDIRMVRYAYGNQNGYIKGYGQELSYTATGSTFSINSGIFVIQGAEVKIDANGWSESVSGVTNKRYYIVYGEVNLASQTAEIKSTYSLSAYPDLPQSDDLTQSTDGTARVELYRFTATNGLIADVQKVIKGIDYFTEQIAAEQAARANAISAETEARINAINSVNSNISTINSRLDNLGFRQGSVSLASGTATVNIVKRTGNYVIGNVVGKETRIAPSAIMLTLPSYFRPKTQYSFWAGVVSTGQGKYFNDLIEVTIRTNGQVYSSGTISGYYITEYNLNFGFEAPPIN